MGRSRIAALGAWLAPAALALLLYAPTARFGFVWDDYNYLVIPPDLRNWNSLWSAIFRPFLDSQNYFRPLALLTLGIEQSAGGGATASHAVGILLHAANSALVGVLGTLLAARLQPPAPAWRYGLCAGLLYAVHPALVEAVAWISGRFDLLVTLFSLLLLIADLTIARTGARAATVALCFLCAALCKEMALGTALLLPLWQLLRQPDPALPLRDRLFGDGNTAVYASVFAAGLAYLGLRWAGLGHLHTAPATLPYDDLAGHAALACRTLAAFWIALFAPFGTLSPLHELGGEPGRWDSGAQLGLLSLLLLGLMLWRGSARNRLLLMGAVIAFIPAMNLLPMEIRQNYFNERFLALPAALAAIWAALVAGDLLQRHRGAGLVAGLVLMAWLMLAVPDLRAAQAHWKTDLDFWLWAYSKSPDSTIVVDNLQASLIERGYFQDSIRLVQSARARGATDNPRRSERLALALFENGDASGARQEMDAALAAGDGLPPAERAALQDEASAVYEAHGLPEQAARLRQGKPSGN